MTKTGKEVGGVGGPCPNEAIGNQLHGQMFGPLERKTCLARIFPVVEP